MLRDLAFDTKHLGQFSLPVRLRTFFSAYKESLLKQYKMISINRRRGEEEERNRIPVP